MTTYKIWLPLDDALAQALYQQAQARGLDLSDYARAILRAAVAVAAAGKGRE